MSKVRDPAQEGTFCVQAAGWQVDPVVTADGSGVVSYAGTVMLAELADRFDLSAAYGKAMDGEMAAAQSAPRPVLESEEQ